MPAGSFCWWCVICVVYEFLAVSLWLFYIFRPRLGYAAFCSLGSGWLPAGRCMQLTRGKRGSARVVCLGLFLVCGLGDVVAQQSDEANDKLIAAATIHDNDGMYMIPGVTGELQGADAAAPAAPGAGLQGNFFQRLGRFYWADWTGKLPSSPAPARRALDAPLDSPPFPSTDWGYGGSPAIGVPDGNVYPLMTALRRENRRIKLYGWIAASGNASTSSTTNFPLSYDIFPNTVQLNQAVVYIERL